jgi:hypothetical protein
MTAVPGGGEFTLPNYPFIVCLKVSLHGSKMALGADNVRRVVAVL